jgi:uncharacterized membrane protein YbhN (UPF0104 family)
VAEPVLDYAATLPRRRASIVRIIIGVVVLAALVVAGRRFYDELYRLRQVSPLLAALIFVLWPASRYPAAVVMRTSLRALGTYLGRYEAFMLQMVQSYSNVLVPRSGIGVVGLYVKLRHGTPLADLGAVQVLPMTLLQLFTIGVMGLLCQASLLSPGGAQPDRLMALCFTAVAVGSVLPLMVPVPKGSQGRGRIAAFLSRLSFAWQRLGRSREVLGRAVVTHAVMLLIRALRVMLCFRAVRAEMPYSGALAASLLADVAFVFAITPSGLGFREAAVVYSANAIGTTHDIAMAAALLDRLVGTVCNVLIGQVGVWQFIRPALKGVAVTMRTEPTDLTPTAAPPPSR